MQCDNDEDIEYMPLRLFTVYFQKLDVYRKHLKTFLSDDVMFEKELLRYWRFAIVVQIEMEWTLHENKRKQNA